LTLDSAVALPVERLVLHLDNAGQSADVVVSNLGLAIPPERHLTLDLDGRAGDVGVRVSAFDGAMTLLGSAAGAVTLEPARTTFLTLFLTPSAADLGVDLLGMDLTVPTGVDLAASAGMDLAVPADLSASLNADLASMLIAHDDFARADQMGWGTASDGHIWGGAGSPYFSISQGNGVVSQGSSSVPSYLATLGPGTSGDVEVFFEGKADSGTTMAGVIDDSGGGSYYSAGIDVGNLTLFILKAVSFVPEYIASQAISYTPGTLYRVRFQRKGNALRPRAWLATSSEPSTWMVSATDPDFTAGTCGLASTLRADGSGTVTYTSFSASTTLSP
jgi:hypothetical protein